MLAFVFTPFVLLSTRHLASFGLDVCAHTYFSVLTIATPQGLVGFTLGYG